MASKWINDASWEYKNYIPGPLFQPLPYLAAVLMLAALCYSVQNAESSLPNINAKRFFELTDTRVKEKFVKGAGGMLDNWFGTHPDQPVQMISDNGLLTVLPPHMAHEIKNNKNLSFQQFLHKVSPVRSLPRGLRL